MMRRMKAAARLMLKKFVRISSLTRPVAAGATVPRSRAAKNAVGTSNASTPMVRSEWFSSVGCACRFCSRIRAPPVKKAMPGMSNRCKRTTPATDAWRIRSLQT
jgi:hypothetical protein